MANVDELWQMATDLYARGQSSNDPSIKQMLMRAAHDYLKQAEEVRRDAHLPPPRLCPVCRVAMVFEPDDPSLGYDVFVCPKCSTKFLVHHPTPDSEDED
jgi:hypothetical protein